MLAFSSRSRLIASAALLTTVLFSLASCHGASEGTVTGLVMLDDEPLAFATVYFICGDGQPRACKVKLDGSYRLEKVPLGTVKIKVVTYPPVPPGLAKAEGPNAPKEQEKARPAVKILPKYSDENTSGLTYEVKQGQHKHDILLSR
jgi:hypothetical protein